jgi:arylformamidase
LDLSIGLRHWQTSGTEFNQSAPLTGQNVKRLASLNEKVRGRLGQPLRRQYGQSQVEALDIYHTNCTNVPVFFFIHGGACPAGLAKNNASPAELFVNAGAHYIALDFIAIRASEGDLGADHSAALVPISVLPLLAQ